MRRWTGESVAGDRYTIDELIGRGRRARVYRGYDTVLLRPVAVKFLPAVPDDRWRAEIAALDRVDHRHVLRLLDGGVAGDQVFLVLPLLRENLARRLRRGPLDRAGTVRTVTALADALGALHRAGLVHGDVDAAGVLLDDDGRPRWGGVPTVPDGAAAGSARDADLCALARLAVRCVTGRARSGAAPAAVLDAIRTVSEHGRHAPGVRQRLTAALELLAPVAPVPARRRLARAGDALRSSGPGRARGRTGPAMVLAAGFAASVFGALLVHGGPAPDGPGGAAGTFAVADPASSESLAAVGSALNRIGAMAGAAVPEAAVSRASAVDTEDTDGTGAPAGTDPDAQRARPVAVVTSTDRPVRRSEPAPQVHDAGGDDRADRDRNPGRGDEERPDLLDDLLGRVLTVLG